jgi:hypothetical protein
MANNTSLIKYGEKVQYGQINKSDKELFKKRKEKDEQEMVSLKSYLDTILPPKESTEGGQIFMQFVSCQPATSREVLDLSVSFGNIIFIRKNLTNNLFHVRRRKQEFVTNVKNFILNALMNL